MTRRSKRELEDLGVAKTDVASDVREGVTAPFVTYEPDGLEDADIPGGCVATETTGEDGTVYRTVRPAGEDVDGDPADG